MTTLRCRPVLSFVVLVSAIALAWPLAVVAPEARVKYQTDYDKTLDFTTLKTWAWHPSGTGEVKLAITAQSDPDRLKRIADPIIVAAVEKEMAARGMTKVTGPADLLVTYWLLGSIGESSQKIGEFVGAVPEWGLPPFQGATQSLRTFPVGTLVLDMFAANGKDVAWRGAARGEVDLDKKPAERKARLDAAIHELLKRFPPKKK